MNNLTFNVCLTMFVHNVLYGLGLWRNSKMQNNDFVEFNCKIWKKKHFERLSFIIRFKLIDLMFCSIKISVLNVLLHQYVCRFGDVFVWYWEQWPNHVVRILKCFKDFATLENVCHFRMKYIVSTSGCRQGCVNFLY